MAGDRSCVWSGWFRAHFEDFEKVPGDFDQARWKIRHTRLLHELAQSRSTNVFVTLVFELRPI